MELCDHNDISIHVISFIIEYYIYVIFCLFKHPIPYIKHFRDTVANSWIFFLCFFCLFVCFFFVFFVLFLKMDPWHIHEAFTRILNLYWLLFDLSCNSRRTIFVRYNITINTNRGWIVSYHSFCFFLFFCSFPQKKIRKRPTTSFHSWHAH